MLDRLILGSALLVLSLIAMGVTDFHYAMQDKYIESQIQEIEIKVTRRRKNPCPKPKIGRLQEYLNCHNKQLFRKDI